MIFCLAAEVSARQPGSLGSRRKLTHQIFMPERNTGDAPCVFCRVYNSNRRGRLVMYTYISPPMESQIHDARYSKPESCMCSVPIPVWFFGDRAPSPKAELLTAAQLACGVEGQERRKEDALTGRRERLAFGPGSGSLEMTARRASAATPPQATQCATGGCDVPEQHQPASRRFR